ncbi:hypothetical protein LCGC14_1696130, partial [marine sediment metagenome]
EPDAGDGLAADPRVGQGGAGGLDGGAPPVLGVLLAAGGPGRGVRLTGPLIFR